MELPIFCVGFLAVLIILYLAWAFGQDATAKQRKEAHTNYQLALDALRQDPTNAKLTEQALSLGREYASLSRDGKGQTTFDEVALMNDINAVTAAKGANSMSTGNSTASAEERLKKLSGLHDKGLITKEEYERRRAAIIESL